MKKFVFMTIEGIDGVGKTTVAQKMKELADVQGIPLEIYQTSFDESPAATEFVNHHFPTDAHFLFYLSVNKFVSDKIAKAICRANIVCVRYIHSTLAYHRAAGTKIKVDLKSLDLVRPDFVFYLDATESNRTFRIRSKKDKKRGDEQDCKKGSFLWKVEKEFKKFPELIRIPTDDISIDEMAIKLLKTSRLI